MCPMKFMIAYLYEVMWKLYSTIPEKQIHYAVQTEKQLPSPF